MLYEKTSYTDTVNQIYAVGARRSENDTLQIIAEFKDINAPGYNASNEADRLLAAIELSARPFGVCHCAAQMKPHKHPPVFLCKS